MFDLPDPGPYRLGRLPLVLALVQVQFPLVGRLQDLTGITPVQDALRAAYPYMERVQVNQVALTLSPAGPIQSPTTQSSVSWKFTDDSGWTAVIEPGSASLSVGPTYTDIGEFAARVQDLLAALQRAVGIPRCDRLGVRFINVAQIAEGETWAQWFRPELTGWIAAGILHATTRLESSISQTIVRGRGTGALAQSPHEAQAIVRHGLLPPGTAIPVASLTPLEPLVTTGFILDIDAFIQGPRPFDVTRLHQEFLALHDQINRFFRWSLADEGLAHFQVTPQ